jgi:membrane protease YdiL (CAAX protease family)
VVYAALVWAAAAVSDPDLLARSDADPAAFFWWQLLDDGVLAALALVVGLTRFPGTAEGLGLRPVPPRRWLGQGVAGGLVAAITAWAVGVGLERLGWEAPVHPVEGLVATAQDLPDLLLVLVTVAGAVPLAEELVFRGVGYRTLRARLGPRVALPVTAAAFAVVHGVAVPAWLPILPVGLVLGLLVETSGSLWPAVVAHGVVNALAVLLG